jgi:glycosyltransferase involved in cell wall biosynthesis
MSVAEEGKLPEALLKQAGPRLTSGEREVELTILMPCLNEAQTIAACISKAFKFLKRNAVSGEVLVADNGSTDGSVAIAAGLGARVENVPIKGYGAALLHGIRTAQGRYIIMGDSDQSYDFNSLEAFLEKLRAGSDLVMGNRFRGGIKSGAMPFLHRYLGNPVLSFLGRLFFSCGVGDFHCGLRGFNRHSILALGLRSRGMEFASEMVVRCSLAGLKIGEVPTTLYPDGRSRPPHLRTWRDGWRHLRFLLLFSPRWLFFYPGIVILASGALLSLALLPGPISIAPNVTLDAHSLIVGCLAILVGMQCISFALISRRYAALRGFLPPSSRIDRYRHLITLERVLLPAAFLFLLGLAGIVYCVFRWAETDFGPLRYAELIRILTLSSTAVALGLQIAFTAFLMALFEVDA